MKKTLNFVKRNFFGFLLGIIFCSISIVLAESINSNEVLYDNSNSKTSYDNVQDVLDEMYNIIDHNSLGFSLLTHNPVGLSTDLIAGLYRYQGNNVDNYICFGTTDKNACTSDNNRYLYRIVGITPNGQMKMIKSVTLDSGYKWNSGYGVSWNQSELYAGLNGSYFLTNTTYIPDSTWSDRILTASWHCLTTSDSNAATMAERELAAATINAKIGLLYLHDYANTGGWLSYANGGWSITRRDPATVFLLVRSAYGYMETNRVVSPAFYLNAGETIASGSGTIDDPYILS